MFKMRVSMVALSLGLSAFLVQAVEASTHPSSLLWAAAQTEVPWRSYAQGFSQAQQQEKFIVLTFVADWCGYCKKMKKTTFADPDVLKAMQRWFVPVQVEEKSQKPVVFEGQQIRERDLLGAYEISGFPATIILKPDGEVLTKVFGYIEPHEFDALLKFVGTRSHEKMTFLDFKKKFAKFIRKS